MVENHKNNALNNRPVKKLVPEKFALTMDEAEMYGFTSAVHTILVVILMEGLLWERSDLLPLDVNEAQYAYDEILPLLSDEDLLRTIEKCSFGRLVFDETGELGDDVPVADYLDVSELGTFYEWFGWWDQENDGTPPPMPALPKHLVSTEHFFTWLDEALSMSGVETLLKAYFDYGIPLADVFG